MNWVEVLETYKEQIFKAEPEADHYYFKDNNSDSLVIVAGDSWTWGASLDSTQRLNQIYGNIVSSYFQADWINIGCSGWSNSWILLHVLYLIEHLQNVSQYKKVYVIITLTENGRDIDTSISHMYDYYTPYLELGPTEDFYQRILNDIELKWIQQVNQMLDISDNRYTFFIGNNFVWHKNLPDACNNNRLIVADNNWIEKLAECQNLPTPTRTNLVSGWIFNTIDKIHKINNIPTTTAFKNWCIPLIEKANQVNQWLDASEINHKKSSKHPNHIGHQIWADYILNTIKQHEQRRT